MSTRQIIIIDYGKDFGYGRYFINSREVKIGSNNWNDILKIIIKFGEPCEGCPLSPNKCNGLDDCNFPYEKLGLLNETV